MTTSRDIAELERTRANLIQVGTVAAREGARARVTLGELTTAALDVLQLRAGKDRTWWPPSVGEQVVVLCPDGDPALGIILGSLYSGAHPAPGESGDLHRTEYGDGAVIDYDSATHSLTATLPAGGTADITAPAGITANTQGAAQITAAGGATITAPLIQLAGNVEVAGTIVMGSGLAGGAIGTIYGSLQQIGGNFATDGSVESAQDVIAQTISLVGHVHDGVQPGSAQTGVPAA